MATEKVDKLEKPYKEACDFYAQYCRFPKERDTTILRAAMRRVNELNVPLLAAKEPLGMINNKIEDNIKNLTLAPIKLVCTNVSTKLPRELRDCIYNYLYSKHVGPPDHRTSMSRLTDLVILRHCIGDSKEMHPLVTFQSWLGESFTCELTEHWYRNNTFNFGSWWTDYMIFWLSQNLWW
jgi:hypothetical protein